MSGDALVALRFDNSFVRELPADPERLRAVRRVEGACFSRVTPLPLGGPRLIAHAAEVARLLDLPEAACASETFLQVFAGNTLLDGMDPSAACYGGHQFGVWAGQLGDGRAISLGEVVNDAGGRWELQLKGAGRTPYARSADGRAVLRSSLREFLCSEAMHHLGVPTTRALSLVAGADRVVRDMFYDGHPREETSAVVCRVAPSFLRFGNFELPAARNDLTLLRRLADYAIRMHFGELIARSERGAPSEPLAPEIYAALLVEICRRTARLMAQWMRVGFVHGVMNTDNMSILGLTIDYGPFGFLDNFDPDFTPNTTDAGERRYRFANQPRIAKWNLIKLAEALYPLIESVPALERALAAYSETYEAEEGRMLAGKLGLAAWRPGDDDGVGSDRGLCDELFRVLALVETDMPIFFRRLAEVPAERGGELPDDALLAPLADAYYAPEAQASGAARARTLAWLRRYVARVREDGTTDGERRARMNAVNPVYLLRNYVAQEAIDAVEAGDAGAVMELLEVLRRPYDEQTGRGRFSAKRPDWARRRPGCSMLSCSS